MVRRLTDAAPLQGSEVRRGVRKLPLHRFQPKSAFVAAAFIVEGRVRGERLLPGT